MLQKTWNWLRALLVAQRRGTERPIPALLHHPQPSAVTQDIPAEADTYDARLLERALEYWQKGEWHKLAAIEQEHLELHPNRGTLAVLAAAASAQQGKSDAAKRLVQQAQVWGCTKQQIAQVFIAGTHQSLGQAAAAAGLAIRSEEHINSARMLAGVATQP